MKEYSILPENGIPRRWFKDAHVEVVVWIQNTHDIYGFQIIYFDKILKESHPLLEERAITYFPDKGLKHSFIRNEEKEFPVTKLLEKKESAIPVDKVVTHLTSHQGDLPNIILTFITKILTEMRV